ANVMFKTLPTTVDVISGKVSINDLREVSIEDLLGRDPVSLDWEAIRQGISGNRVLVTGGGGSIGSELCRQICALKPEALTIFDQSEFNLFIIENELKERFSGLVLNARLGDDVCDTVAVEHLMDIAKPNIVFHAAAYKHVPMLEDQVREAAHNNIIGTSNVVSASIQHNVEEFVLISTDKAVNPTNIMGSSKRIAEMLCQKTLNDVSTKFITVRFGNVLNSAGSVVPIFREQIASGGPVTVTHEEITRYFMTIPEACQLIMQAGVIGQGGEIFVLDMGEPVKIKYLAEQMIILSGKEPGVDIEIQYMGLRPGEKLFEELFHENEALTPTVHEKIRLANSRDFDSRELDEVVDQIREAAQRYDEMTIRQAIEMLVPEYHSGNDEIRSAAAILNKAG
ncbi:MAG: polysaccharide biosynthesis protein, partial [Gammaproteobacteria bacterium]